MTDKVTPHFTWAEFACKDGTPVPDWGRERIISLAQQLEVIRHAAGDRPIRIVSGYRTPEYNRKVGGARRSQHMQCRAADIQVEGMTPEEVHQLVLHLIADGAILEGGVGLYPAFVHYDIRGRKARWRGSRRKV